jgi:hypothetical protein
MANRSRPTLLKREREKARVEKQKAKEARRAERTHRQTPDRTSGVDPDIAHIRPGPQPPADWQVDPDENETP